MKNNKERLRSIYTSQIDQLFSYGCRFADREAVKDCIHDVFVALYAKENIDSIRDIRYYLWRSLRNRPLDEAIKKSVRSLDETILAVPSGEIPDQRIEGEERMTTVARMLEKAMDRLSYRQKEAVSLYYIDELSYDEIGALMGLKYQSVRNLIHQALKKMRVSDHPEHKSYGPREKKNRVGNKKITKFFRMASTKKSIAGLIIRTGR